MPRRQLEHAVELPHRVRRRCIRRTLVKSSVNPIVTARVHRDVQLEETIALLAHLGLVAVEIVVLEVGQVHQVQMVLRRAGGMETKIFSQSGCGRVGENQKLVFANRRT